MVEDLEEEEKIRVGWIGDLEEKVMVHCYQMMEQGEVESYVG